MLLLKLQILNGILIDDYYRVESIGKHQLRMTNSKFQVAGYQPYTLSHSPHILRPIMKAIRVVNRDDPVTLFDDP